MRGRKSRWFGTSIGVDMSDREMMGAVNGRSLAPLSSSCVGCHPTESVWCQETERRGKSQNSCCWARQENKAGDPRKEGFWSSLLVVTFPTWERSVCSTAEVISGCFWMAKCFNNERLFPVLFIFVVESLLYCKGWFLDLEEFLFVCFVTHTNNNDDKKSKGFTSFRNLLPCFLGE